MGIKPRRGSRVAAYKQVLFDREINLLFLKHSNREWPSDGSGLNQQISPPTRDAVRVLHPEIVRHLLGLDARRASVRELTREVARAEAEVRRWTEAEKALASALELLEASPPNPPKRRMFSGPCGVFLCNHEALEPILARCRENAAEARVFLEHKRAALDDASERGADIANKVVTERLTTLVDALRGNPVRTMGKSTWRQDTDTEWPSVRIAELILASARDWTTPPCPNLVAKYGAYGRPERALRDWIDQRVSRQRR